MQKVIYSGYIFSYNESHLLKEIDLQVGNNFEKNSREYISGLNKIWTYNDFLSDNSLNRSFYYNIAAIFKLLDILTDKPIKIGIRFRSQNIVQDLVTELWKRKLNIDFPVEINTVKPSASYDFIITDYRLETDDESKTYLTNDLNSDIDIILIKKEISVIYKNRQ